ncbi:VOC family protein [Natrialba swarupiae]|uniref:VOC family protein n=1 Tax=Natrialba swarupiae TaxID=2448032 RepID=A0A5D5AU73_9EURY|nr:VOC family protein [Natrialba swarupiae]TYT62601.1 VOC family protein [Natrialba swarupiae]
MDVSDIDHVNIRIPTGSVDEAVAFYRDGLGFEPENLDRYRDGERTIFSFRLNERCILHVRPVESFSPPDGKGFDHFAIVVEESIEEVRERLEEADIEIERDGNPLGATGRAPAVYVRDPFDYLIEIKTAQQS